MRLKFLLFCILTLTARVSASNLKTVADNLSFDFENKICFLNGNASVSFSLKDRDIFFTASRIDVYFSSDDSDLKTPQKIEALSGVKLEIGDMSISALSCVFMKSSGTIEFKGDVKIARPNFDMTAQKAVYNVETKTIDVRSDKKVRAIVSDEKKLKR